MSEREYPEGAAESERDEAASQEGFGSEGAVGGSSQAADPADSPSVDGSEASPADGAVAAHERAPNMLPGRARRRTGVERFVVRLVATGGVIGIGVGIAAILAANHVQGWIIGLAVASLSVVLSAILWSSRQM